MGEGLKELGSVGPGLATHLAVNFRQSGIRETDSEATGWLASYKYEVTKCKLASKIEKG